VAGNGYTNLENYLNSLSAQAVWHADADASAGSFINWRGERPTSAWSIANFGDVVTARRTVTLDTPLSAQDVTFDSPRGYLLTGTGPLTLDALSGFATLTVVSGTHTVAAPLVLADAARITVAGGSAAITFSGGIAAGGRTITKTGSGSMAVPGLSGAGLVVSQGSVLFGATAPGGNRLTALAIDEVSGAAVDIGGDSVTVAPAGITRAAFLADLVAGRNGGAWNGPGIRSATVAAEVAAGLPRAIGWIDAGDGSLLAAYAAPGDTNVDRSIDILDASNFLAGGKFDTASAAIWIQGDFTYDGLVDILDAAEFFATNLYDAGPYGPQASSPSVAAVPEPSLPIMSLVSAAGVAAVRRRFRRTAIATASPATASMPPPAGSGTAVRRAD
jgi:hypothetical protein